MGLLQPRNVSSDVTRRKVYAWEQQILPSASFGLHPERVADRMLAHRDPHLNPDLKAGTYRPNPFSLQAAPVSHSCLLRGF